MLPYERTFLPILAFCYTLENLNAEGHGRAMLDLLGMLAIGSMEKVPAGDAPLFITPYFSVSVKYQNTKMIPTDSTTGDIVTLQCSAPSWMPKSCKACKTTWLQNSMPIRHSPDRAAATNEALTLYRASDPRMHGLYDCLFICMCNAKRERFAGENRFLITGNDVDGWNRYSGPEILKPFTATSPVTLTCQPREKYPVDALSQFPNKNFIWLKNGLTFDARTFDRISLGLSWFAAISRVGGLTSTDDGDVYTCLTVLHSPSGFRVYPGKLYKLHYINADVPMLSTVSHPVTTTAFASDHALLAINRKQRRPNSDTLSFVSMNNHATNPKHQVLLIQATTQNPADPGTKSNLIGTAATMIFQHVQPSTAAEKEPSVSVADLTVIRTHQTSLHAVGNPTDSQDKVIQTNDDRIGEPRETETEVIDEDHEEVDRQNPNSPTWTGRNYTGADVDLPNLGY